MIGNPCPLKEPISRKKKMMMAPGFAKERQPPQEEWTIKMTNWDTAADSLLTAQFCPVSFLLALALAGLTDGFAIVQQLVPRKDPEKVNIIIRHWAQAGRPRSLMEPVRNERIPFIAILGFRWIDYTIFHGGWPKL